MNKASGMKKLALVLGVVVLAGCGVAPPNVRLDNLREPVYLRTVRELSPKLTFAKIQMALFKHTETCGSGPEFAADPLRPSYASVTQKLTAAGGPEHIVLVDLVMRMGRPIKARAYTYFTGADQQVEQVFAAIDHPEVCP